MHLILNWTEKANPVSDFAINDFVSDTIQKCIVRKSIQTIDVCNELVVNAFRVQRDRGILQTLVLSYTSTKADGSTVTRNHVIDERGRYENGYPDYFPGFAKMEDYLTELL